MADETKRRAFYAEEHRASSRDAGHWYVRRNKDGHWAVADTTMTARTSDEAQTMAERIAAALCTVEGITTAELEGVSVKAMREALESAADALRVVDENGSDGFSATVSMALTNVRAALGKDGAK